MMGYLLVQGVEQHLQSALPDSLGTAALRDIANGIASGNLLAAQTIGIAMSPEALTTIAREALTQSFGGVMLYAGISVWLMAALSFVIFSGSSKTPITPE